MKKRLLCLFLVLALIASANFIVFADPDDGCESPPILGPSSIEFTIEN